MGEPPLVEIRRRSRLRRRLVGFHRGAVLRRLKRAHALQLRSEHAVRRPTGWWALWRGWGGGGVFVFFFVWGGGPNPPPAPPPPPPAPAPPPPNHPPPPP